MDTQQAASTTATNAPTPAATHLTLVRHGQTQLNALRRLQGSCDSPLTRTGRTGVLVTAQHLSTHTFDAAYSSPQGRAVTTAVEIVRRHADLRLRTLSGLRELSFGVFERRPEHAMESEHPWAQFVPEMLAGRHPGLPGGESGAEFMARVAAAFTQITAAHRSGRVLVVGHGLTLGAYLCLLGVRGLAGLPNASVTRVAVEPDGAAHLLEIGTDIAGHGSVATRVAPAATGSVRGISQADAGTPEGASALTSV